MDVTAAPHRTLAYLSTLPTERLKGVGAGSMRRLDDAGIRSVADLLLTPPRRYLDRSQLAAIGTAPIGEEVTVGGTVLSFSARRISGGRMMINATIGDGGDVLHMVSFNKYLKLDEGEEVALSGKISIFNGKRQMKAPAIDRLNRMENQKTGRVIPVYPKVKGVKPHLYTAAITNAVARSLPLADPVPDQILDRLDLVDRTWAIHQTHEPDEIGNVAVARRRMVFDEFLRIQMALRARAHDLFESQAGVANSVEGELYHRYLDAQPFSLTPDQSVALSDITSDMAAPTPLHRLLQGEVGSGKTVVVVAALLTSVESGHQGTVMAPTEVLATQHYLGTESALAEAGLAPPTTEGETGTGSLFATELPADRPVRIGLFTSSRVTVNFRDGDVSRKQGLAWLADGTIDIAFGTHALIQPDVEFNSLGITVVDEQHRFGVEQRVQLRDRDTTAGVPDLLLLTATPIPRTFVMALYGDLDVSTIETMPPGRSPVATRQITGSSAVADADRAVARAVAGGHQVFVVCPLVDDSDKIEARSAESEFRRMSSALPDIRIALLHGQMSSDQKAETMDRFRRNEVDVLVATTVVEVGVDVPNATLIVIWNAERFGLSQLHQLRGRVGRGSAPGECVLIVENPTEDAETRLDAMVGSNDGFALAEVDLEIRGAGTLLGASQSGAGDLRFGDVLRDAKAIGIASEVAREAVTDDRNSVFVEALIEEFNWFVGDSGEWLTKS
ncbi:MAG: ATP-dependent DNA helicase RecG [Acidimicrobiia bacterium]